MLLAQSEVTGYWCQDHPAAPYLLVHLEIQRPFSTSKLWPSSQPSSQPASTLWVLVLNRVNEGSEE